MVYISHGDPIAFLQRELTRHQHYGTHERVDDPLHLESAINDEINYPEKGTARCYIISAGGENRQKFFRILPSDAFMTSHLPRFLSRIRRASILLISHPSRFRGIVFQFLRTHVKPLTEKRDFFLIARYTRFSVTGMRSPHAAFAVF